MFYACILFVTLLHMVPGVYDEAQAVPETWFRPSQTVAGASSSGFGSAVACSSEVGGLNYSYIAVGAPLENSGEGRVHIVTPGGGIVTTLAPPTLGGTGNFGYAVTFVNDINGDSIEELVVGEPDSDGASGMVHVYLSQAVPGNPFLFCGSQIDAPSFGSFIVQTSNPIAGGVQIVVGIPEQPGILAFNITDSMGACLFSNTSSYQSGSSAGSRYGQCIGEVDTGSGFDLVVGAPRNLPFYDGVIYSKSEFGAVTSRHSGGVSEQFGVSVASRQGSNMYGFNAPYATSLSQTVHIKEADHTNVCSLYIPMADLADTASQSLVHMGTAFDDFANAAGVGAFASYRTETDTGGSAALFGIKLPTGLSGEVCHPAKQVNNCVLDVGQRQGHAITGGQTCVTSSGKSLLVVGAPGYDANRGRIDVYEEGSELQSAASCIEPTATPTATPTPTPEPSPIHEPTATPGFVTPIPVDPKTTGLPAPAVNVAAKFVVLEAPVLVGRSSQQRFSGYLFLVTQTSSRASVSLLSAEASALVARSTTGKKRREIFSRRNRITLRNLGRGTYAASYRPVFTQGKGKAARRILGRVSAKRVFKVG